MNRTYHYTMSQARSESDNDPSLSEAPRLPSARPIDRRWNHSRGIILSNAKRNAGGNFTWSHGDGIVFADPPASRRGYASRKVFPLDSNARQSPKTSKEETDLMNNPYKLGKADIPSDHGNLNISLQREQNAHKATVKTHGEEKHKLEKNHRRELEQIRETVEEKKAQLVAENAAVREAALEAAFGAERLALQDTLRKNEADRKKLEGERKRNQEVNVALEKRKRQLNAGESQLASERNELDSTIAKEKYDAKEAAKNEYESLMHSTETLQKELRAKKKAVEKREDDAASDAKERRELFSADRDHLAEEWSQRLQQNQTELRRAGAEMVAREIKELRQGPILRHDVDRKDYEAYHALWDQTGERLSAYSSDTVRLQDRLDKSTLHRWRDSIRSFDRWKDAPRLSDRGKNSSQSGYDADTCFAEAYPVLSRQLMQFLESSAQEASKTANHLSDLQHAVSGARSALNTEAHFSRRLTKFHHFEEGSNLYAKMSLVSTVLNEEPLLRFSDELRVRRESLQKQGEAATTIATIQSLRQQSQTCTGMISQIRKLKQLYRQVRRVEALEALQHDGPSEKAIFAVTQRARDLQDEAWSDWSESIDESTAEVSREQLKSDRTEFRNLYGKARGEREDLARSIRKRILLEEHLEEVSDKAMYDDAIEKELKQAKHERDKALERLAGGGGAGSSSFTRQAPSPRIATVRPSPVVPRTQPWPVSNTSTKIPSQVAMQSEITALNRRLEGSKAYESAEEKEKDTQRLNDLRILIRQQEIETLTRKKGAVLRKSPPNHAAAVRIQKEIDSRTAQLARAQLNTETTLEEAERVAVTPQSSAAPSTSPTIRKHSGGRLQIRKQRTKKGISRSPSASSSPSAASSKKSEKNSSSGVVNFKPTGSKKASHPYWSSDVRSLSTTSSTSSGARLASPSGSSSRGSNRASDRHAGLSQAIRQLSLEPSRAETPQHVDANIGRPFGFFSSNNTETAFKLKSNESDDSTDTFANLGIQTSSTQSSDIPSNLDPAEQSSARLSEDSSQDLAESEEGENADMPAELEYKMPPEDYRNALLASKNTNAAYWSYKLYKNANGKTPLLLYCVSYDTAEARAKEFLNEQVIGFDIEWEPFAKKDSPPKQNVSLIQIAAEGKIGLFHIALFNGSTPEELMPPSLRAILESRNIAKAGVNISGDARRLREHLNVDMQGLFELSHLYRVVELSPSQVNRRLVKLSEQVQKLLGLPLKKDSVQTSAWSKKLQLEQTEYAASDAYAGFRLYHVLEAKRKLMDPMPPRPAFWEDHKPLQLGDGRAIVPRPYVPKRKREVAEEVEEEGKEDDDACEEFFDTVEEVDAGLAEPIITQESFQSYTSSDDSFISLPHSEEASDADDAIEEPPLYSQTGSQSTIPQSPKPHTHAHKTTRHNHAVSSPEVHRADLWVTTWRASLPVEYNLKVGNPTLRAYHMWHEQGLNCYDVAALLRDPPLAPQTIASYVMTALKEEDLPFDAERVKEPLGILPKSVHGRYRKVLERVGGVKTSD